jgi:hypothetical protein
LTIPDISINIVYIIYMYKDKRILAEKNKIKFLAVIAAIGFAFTACPEPETSKPVITTITITTQPAATTNVTAGSISGSLSVTASVSTNAALRYQWYKNTSAVNKGGSAISAATSASFTIPATLETGTYYYFCEVRAAGAAAVRSNVATVTVTAEPAITTITITTQPAAMTNVTAGSISGSLSVTASVTPIVTLNYQWYSSINTGNTDGSAISAATSASYTIPANLTAGTYYYFCEVRVVGANSVRSNVATVNVTPAAASGPVIKVLFTGTETTKSVTLNSLNKNEIYLVKVNTSNSVVSAANTGGSSGSSISVASGNIAPGPDDMPKVRMGHPAADEYHANPPPFERRKSRSPDGPLGSSFPSAPTVGTAALFWVESSYGGGIFVQKTATLRALGTCGNIWVMNDLTTFTSAQAQAMADKFDLLYPIETSLLGDDFGGWDIDSKIQLLVYDIGYSPTGTTLGYFWGKDMRTDIGSGQRSNEAAMFYLNGNANVFTNFGADTLYSTLVHEFQHMIHHARKSMKGLNSATWYNEMLSMTTEDVISPLIGIGPTNQGHPIQRRIPGTSGFLNRYYAAGITEWDSGGNTLDSYAIAYAFGAYLLRNYGGASLLQEMLANDSIDIASVTAALRTVNADSEPSFEEALRRFGEAMVFSGTLPADVQSFDKTATKTIGGYTYTASKFNIWADFGSTKPKIFGVNEQRQMRPHSITVHQAASGWKNQSGTKTITLQRPNDSNVEFYLMVK